MFGMKAALEVYQATKARGETALASEYTMVIDGAEDMTYQIKQFPVPIVAPEDVVEASLNGGIKTFVPQTPRMDFRGTIAFEETANAQVRQLIEKYQSERSVRHRPRFNATIYHGTQSDYAQKWRIIDAVLFGFDPFDADRENRGAVTIITGQIAYMYFGDELE